MASNNKETRFLTVEWTVENCSCWNRKIHGKRIASPRFKADFDLLTLALELYPRGVGGQGDKAAVRVRYRSNSDFSGDFFLTTADGRLLWAHELRAGEGVGALELTSAGPEFGGDELTLKCRIVWDYDEAHRARTAIAVFDSAWKLSTRTFVVAESVGVKFLATIRYPLDDDDEEWGELGLSVEVPHSNALIVLEPGRFSSSKVAVLTRLEVVAGSVSRTEAKEHLFVDGKRWTLCDSLTSEEVAREGFGAVLRVRAVPKNRCRHRREFAYAPKDVREVTGDYPFRSKTPRAVSQKDDVLSRDLRCLYRDRDHSDFRITSGDFTFPVHRAVLSARSPVFKRMLSSGMAEATSGRVDVSADLDPPTLGLFLAFLYSGEADLRVEGAIGLYYAADKYEVPSLKEACADLLCSNVSLSNVCDVLSLADRHQDGWLESAAQDFVLENYNAVLTSEEWEGFLVREPLLAHTTLTSVSVRRGHT